MSATGKTESAPSAIVPSSGSDLSALVVFFSFDLVNSTRYKSINRRGWPIVARRFYEAVLDAMTKWLVDGRFRVWKYVGDEVLLYEHISNAGQLRKCLDSAMQVIQAVTDVIHAEFPDTRQLLSVKGTLWCARVYQYKPGEQGPAATATKGPLNLVFRSTGGGDDRIDFLGPDIDGGFRIAKHTMRRRLVVSAELAYLLYLNRGADEEVEKQLKIVSYEILKGVWDDRHYPILWYERDWGKIQSSFWYDEHFDNELVRKLTSNLGGLGALGDLTKVLKDLDRYAELQQLWADLTGNKLAKEDEIFGHAKELASRVEVHCVAVCFRHDGRVLVAKRPANKARFAGLWEFGCGQLAEGETFAECLQRNYKSDFGIELLVGETPRPIQSYVIEGGKRKIPGVVFVAEIANPDDAKPTKHTALDWINPDQLPPDVDTAYVPASRERFRLAAEARRK